MMNDLGPLLNKRPIPTARILRFTVQTFQVLFVGTIVPNLLKEDFDGLLQTL